MEDIVVAAILAASLLHASWHALVKSTGDRVIALGGMNAVSALVSLALLPFAKPLPAIAFWIIAGSVVLHFGYKVALARLYRVSDLGQAYPLARGLTPLMATSLAFLVIGEAPQPYTIAGIVLVCGGIALLAFEGHGRGVALSTFATALGASLAVAGYSVVDAYGVRMTGDTFSFTVWLMVADGGVFVAYAFATRRGEVLRAWSAGLGRVLVSGLFGLVSFSVFMWALGRAPVGAVSALRETSVLFAAVIGGVILGERASWLRYAAAAAVATGVGIISLAK